MNIHIYFTKFITLPLGLDIHYKNYVSLKSLHNCYYVITIKLIMRRWKVKFKRKFLYLLDNREYTKMKNGDATSPSQVSALYIYIDLNKLELDWILIRDKYRNLNDIFIFLSESLVINIKLSVFFNLKFWKPTLLHLYPYKF